MSWTHKNNNSNNVQELCRYTAHNKFKAEYVDWHREAAAAN